MCSVFFIWLILPYTYGNLSHICSEAEHARRQPITETSHYHRPHVHKEILAAATREKVSVSAWMTSAAREALHRRAGSAAVAEWEKQHGPFSAQEMEEARRGVRAQLRNSRAVRRRA